MPYNDAIVFVIDYNPIAALAEFVGKNPLELMEYLQRLVQPAARQIEMFQPNKYKAKGEAHQAIWLKAGRDEGELAKSVFKLVLNLAQELDRVNAEAARSGLPPATFHAGLSEGKVDLESDSVSGDGLENAYACAEHARKVGAMLTVSAEVFERVRFFEKKSSDFKSSINGSQRIIDLGRDALSAMVADTDSKR